MTMATRLIQDEAFPSLMKNQGYEEKSIGRW